MRILALEFSSDRRSVAVALAGAIRGRAAEAGGRESHPFRLIEIALREAGAGREQIEVLAVGLGPGSYNGIRSAIAVAQGWQLARPVRLVGVSSVACLAAQARASGLTGAVSCVVDAQRGEFYLARYQIAADSIRETEALHLAPREEIVACAAAGDALVGPTEPRGVPAFQQHYPEAAILAQLAAARDDFVRGDALEPIYLRAAAFVKAPPPRAIPGI